MEAFKIPPLSNHIFGSFYIIIKPIIFLVNRKLANLIELNEDETKKRQLPPKFKP